jgi:hypothetical protein
MRETRPMLEFRLFLGILRIPCQLRSSVELQLGIDPHGLHTSAFLTFIINKKKIKVAVIHICRYWSIQVCTLATYSYFIACLVARQYTGPSTAIGAIDIYFPIGTVLELVFYVGLLKVSVTAHSTKMNDI